ncbi:hypothetical protein FDF11_15485 [Clostridium botulinum]|nr:hypothetical protein [Clostridium botulinum]NFR15919.1 hypothetical protein [Clostridium botulinum]NFR45130.1 hypothetical protein [Clostridium botulinum]NFS52026.1 hypothetical protein [Clostridium botulinum]
MFFYKELSLSLLFLASTQIILCIVLIKNHRIISGTNLGPKIGTFIDGKDFNLNLNTSKSDKIIVFVDIGCISCKNVIKKLQKNGISFENITVITKGNMDEIEQWKSNEHLILDIKSLKDNNIENKYNIKAFPYYIKITNNKVSEKGFLNEINILKLYKEVEQ